MLGPGTGPERDHPSVDAVDIDPIATAASRLVASALGAREQVRDEIAVAIFSSVELFDRLRVGVVRRIELGRSRELRDGAQQLLRGEGDLGNALFSASMGGTPIEKILEALAAEADQLFKGRATANVSIRPAAHRFKELLGKSRDAMVNPEAWERIEKELGETHSRKNALEGDIAGLDRELAWITRCEDALPCVGKLSEEMKNLGQLPPLPDVASDFDTRARDARKAVTDAQAEVTVRLETPEGKIINGTGANIDTVVASALAYINALCKLQKMRSKESLLPAANS